MKKLSILCAVMLFAFCGCQSKSIPQGETPEENAEEIIETQSETPAWMSQDYETAPPPAETVVPDSKEIDEGASSLDMFQYEVFADTSTAMITDFNGADTDLIITSHIGAYPVTEIGQYAFEAAWDVTSITLPETVTVIHEQAFADCESLVSINIPESVTTLERGAFSNCLSLTELVIPAGVTVTEEELLTGCQLQDLYVMNPTLEYNSWGLEEADQKCTIHAPSGSAVLTWAEENGFPTEIE